MVVDCPLHRDPHVLDGCLGVTGADDVPSHLRHVRSWFSGARSAILTMRSNVFWVPSRSITSPVRSISGGMTPFAVLGADSAGGGGGALELPDPPQVSRNLPGFRIPDQLREHLAPCC